jgi:hypothetical protein
MFRILLSQIIYHDKLSIRKLRKAIWNHVFPKTNKKDGVNDQERDEMLTITYQDEDNDVITMNLPGDIYDAVIQFETVGSMRLYVTVGGGTKTKAKKNKNKKKSSSSSNKTKKKTSTTTTETTNKEESTKEQSQEDSATKNALLPTYHSSSLLPLCGLFEPLYNLREW